MGQNKTKKDILEAAYWLFYEKGYCATSLEEIAEACSSQKQAVTYHFGSKAGLGREVSSTLALRNYAAFERIVREALGAQPAEEIAAAHILWFSQVYKNDEKAFRFFREFIMQDENFLDLVQNVRPSFERDIVSRAVSAMDAVRQMQMLNAFYAGKGLLYHYAMGNLAADKELFEQYYFSIYYQPFYSEKERKELFERGKNILSRLGEEKAPYFMEKFM